jgi:hypothetical protein
MEIDIDIDTEIDRKSKRYREARYRAYYKEA